MILPLLASTLRVSTPLIFGAMGGLMCERAGVINLALEGFMLVGALGGALGTLWTHSPWVGAGCGMLAGGLMAGIYAVSVLDLRANQIIAGMAINLLALGLTPLVCKSLFDVTGSTPSIPLEYRWETAPVWLSWILVALCCAFFRFTRGGLRLIFAGEHPEALAAAGVSVKRIRYAAILTGSMLAALGGASLSICLSSGFSRNMTAGRGFIALAALIFGKWRPIPAALASLLFGFAEALQVRAQSGAWFGGGPLPALFIQLLPYVVPMIVLAGFVGRARPPRSLGTPLEDRS
jgi:ABC-type uncharacterized transport system permease subunit